MNQLHVTGKQKIGNFEFVAIEGGFGKDKKAMTVKDIARIHETTVKRINEVINNNAIRFIDGVDIIDLKSVVVPNDLEQFGFSQNAINRSNNIYVLSERGYAKLLKILEDDTAWEIYDQLVDNYFSMKATLDTSNLSPELQFMNSVVKSLAKQELETKRIETKVDNITEIVALNSTDWRKDSQHLIRQMAKAQGGYGAYQEIHSEIYQELDRRANSNLSIRLENKRNRMARAGVSQTKINKTNKLDVIGENKRLLEIYLAIVKEFAIKYGVWKDE